MNITLLVQTHLMMYLKKNNLEWDSYPELAKQLLNMEDMQNRKNMNGHVTSSFLLLDPSKTKILMIHHRGFDTWMCPGGHYEGYVAPRISAIRELEEETGFPSNLVGWLPGDTYVAFDIDTHHIPSRPHKNEGEHLHHDFLYIGIALEDFEPVPQEEEVSEAKWVDIDEAAEYPDQRVRRVVARLKEYLSDF